MPKISIVVPAFNAEKEIEKCVNSIINQTFRDWELILIDDGSTDGTLEVCTILAEQDSRIQLIHQENRGVSATRNRGIELANGVWITFIDADDWVDDKCLEVSYYKACEQDADIVMWNMQDEFSNGNIKKYYPMEGTERIFENDEISYIESMMLIRLSEKKRKNQTGVLMGPCCKLIRKSCVENIYFPETLSFGEDSCFCFQLIRKCKKLVYIDDFFYHRVIKDTSLSHYIGDDMWKKRIDYVNWILRFMESEVVNKISQINYFCYMDYRSLLINYFFSDSRLSFKQKKNAIKKYKESQIYEIDYNMIKDWYKPIIKHNHYFLLFICGKIKNCLFKLCGRKR